MAVNVNFALSFKGNEADDHLLDFYDAADALTGFQRSLALTVHLVLHGEIITQAPALKGARILIKSPEPGSWKVIATVGMLMSGATVLGTASRDTVYGHLATSVYDYVVNESLGFHVDFDKTLGEQYEEIQKKRNNIAPKVTQSQVDALIEKVESSVKEMHRPIYASRTASTAELSAQYKRAKFELATLDENTFEYINYTTQVETPFSFHGKISSYNINTFSGRVYVPEEKRPIPFELAENVRDVVSIARVTESLSLHALSSGTSSGLIKFNGFRFESNTSRLKKILITGVDHGPVVGSQP